MSDSCDSQTAIIDERIQNKQESVMRAITERQARGQNIARRIQYPKPKVDARNRRT